MGVEWYYAAGGRRHGPVSAAELRRLAATGGLAPDDGVWKGDSSSPVPARSVKGLFLPAPPPAAERPTAAVLPDWVRDQQGVSPASAVDGPRPAVGPRVPPAGGGPARPIWLTPARVAVAAGLLLGGGLLAAALAAGVIWYATRTPAGSSADTPAAGDAVSARELVAAYRDPLTAHLEARYRGKPTLVTGRVARVNTEYLAELDLEVVHQGRPAGRIGCKFGDAGGAALTPALQGQTVRVRGFLKYHSFDGRYLTFEGCELVPAGGPEAVPADRLIDECRGVLTGVDDKYRGKVVRVTGAVRKADVDGWQGTPEVSLQAGTETGEDVVCRFRLTDRDTVGRLGPGDEITAAGTCVGHGPSWVMFENCEVVRVPDRLRPAPGGGGRMPPQAGGGGRPAPAAGRVTRDRALSGLRKGMTEGEVSAALGPPETRTAPLTVAGVRRQEWVYGGADNVMVFFADGRLESASSLHGPIIRR